MDLLDCSGVIWAQNPKSAGGEEGGEGKRGEGRERGREGRGGKGDREGGERRQKGEEISRDGKEGRD